MRAILLPLILVFTPTLQAGSARTVDCRLIKLGTGGNLTAVVVAPDNGNEIKCPLPTGKVSGKVTCPVVNDAIPFLSYSDKSPVATAAIPAGMKSALLVLSQTKATEKETRDGQTPPPTWRILVIDDSGKNLGKGGGLVANCTSAEMRFAIGGKQEILPSMASGVFKMPKERNDFNMAPVKCEIRRGDKWVVTRENPLRFLPDICYFIFSYQDARSGRPRVHIVQDSK